ncbi:MAG: SDR family oxidoreductase [Clostridium sp.]|nr:SDR family oxidoreductase [Clostridium sp.]
MMGKTVLITGASGGIGYEFVKLFAKDGYDIVLVARSEDKLNRIKSEFNDVNVTVISKDLIKKDSAVELYKEVKERNIKVDVLINNAGFGLMGEFEKLDIEKQVSMIELNNRALTELTYYFLTDMKKRGSGKILNVASTAAFQPGPNMAVYFASKAFVLYFSEALVEELKGSGVTVTTLCPGPSKTNFSKVANLEKSIMFSKMMSAESVAKLGYKGLIKGKRVVIAGKMNKLEVYAVKILPRALAAKAAKFITKNK